MIENDSNFLAVLRYIHQNPIKAGICEDISAYKWNNYKEFIGNPNIIDTEFVFTLMTKEEFIRFNQQESSEKFLDYEKNSFRISDPEAKVIIAEISNCNNVAEFQQIDSLTKKVYIKKFKENGISIRQINRLTGVSKGIIERA